MGSSMTVFAAPAKMKDGGVFDAEYYAENNADVVQVLGTDPATLYEHYKIYGRAEGRRPCAPETNLYAVEANLSADAIAKLEPHQRYTLATEYIQAVPDIWSGTPDDLSVLAQSGQLQPGYNYTVTGKVTYSSWQYMNYPAASTNIRLETSVEGASVYVTISTANPVKIGDVVTVKGFLGRYDGGAIRLYGCHVDL